MFTQSLILKALFFILGLRKSTNQSNLFFFRVRFRGGAYASPSRKATATREGDKSPPPAKKVHRINIGYVIRAGAAQIDSDALPGANWRVRGDWCRPSRRHVGSEGLIVRSAIAACRADAIVSASGSLSVDADADLATLCCTERCEMLCNARYRCWLLVRRGRRIF